METCGLTSPTHVLASHCRLFFQEVSEYARVRFVSAKKYLIRRIPKFALNHKRMLNCLLYSSPCTRGVMKLISLFLVLLLPLYAFAEESCSLQEADLTPESPLAQRLFYVGTCHYRKKEYAEAVQHWKKLSVLTNVEPEYVELQTSSLNNLGYMLFFGYGIAKDEDEALTYWHKAIGLGHIESEYHLCHAYADSEASTYSPVKALPHCEKSKLLYQGMPEKTSDEVHILKQINHYLEQLKK